MTREMFGSMKPLSPTEYFDIYNTTGLDVDGRRQMLLNVIPVMKKHYENFDHFLEAFPGFMALPLKDRILIREGY